MSVIKIDDINLVLIPGEIFPELYYSMIPSEGMWIAIGLADDEIGYIVNPDDFVLDSTLPYIESASGHYEETNSCGPETYSVLCETFDRLLKKFN